MNKFAKVCILALTIFGVTKIYPISDYVYTPWDLNAAQEYVDRIVTLSAENDGSCSPKEQEANFNRSKWHS